MKNIFTKYKVFSSLIVLVIVLGVVFVSYQNASNLQGNLLGIGNDKAMAALENAQQRVLVTPASAEAERKLRGLITDVRHEFEGKFTANVPKGLLKSLEGLAEVQEVPIYHPHRTDVSLSAKPICGNGVGEGGEKCGEPGLSCSEGFECENCKCIETSGGEEPPTRTCTPYNQVNYYVTQVNGGQSAAGDGVTVAVLDTGIDTDHPDLTGRIVDCKDASKRGIRKGCADIDSVAHGTHVAGVIAADSGSDGLGLIGVAPGADLMILKVCGPSGCYTDDIAAAIDYAGQNGADIINMSLGGSTESILIRNAIARNPNVLYVASAGNSGPEEGSIEYPGANPSVIAVAANDSSLTVADFSSRGITDGDDNSIVAREVELSAGGVFIESANNDGCYSYLSGTSFSSPTVTGLAAKVWQGNAEATRNYLTSIASDIISANGGGAGIGYDIASGYGLPVAP